MKTLDSQGPIKMLVVIERKIVNDYFGLRIFFLPKLLSPAIFAFIDSDRVGVIKDPNVTSFIQVENRRM
jgi:hypothetical protein